MLIHVECPVCGNRYHLRPEMVGQRMRCTNQTCRAIFEVQEANSATSATGAPQPPQLPPPPPPPPPAVSKSARTARPPLGVPGRPVASQPTPPAVQSVPPAVQPSSPAVQSVPPSVHVADWTTAAPPPIQRAPATTPTDSDEQGVKSSQPSPPRLRPESASLPTTAHAPVQPAPSVKLSVKPSAEPPTADDTAPQQFAGATSVSATDDSSFDAVAAEERSSDAVPVLATATSKRKSGRGVLLALVTVLVLVVSGVAVGVYFLAGPAGEVERFEQAKKDFESRKYNDAARSFTKLAADFPSNRAEYQLLADLASLRSETDSVLFDPKQAIASFRTLRDNPADSAVQARHRIWIWEAAVQLVGKVLQRAEEHISQKDYALAETLNAQVEALLAELPNLPKVEQMHEQIEQLRQRHNSIIEQIARGRALTELLGRLQPLLNENPTEEKIEQALALVRAVGFERDPQIRRLIDDARRQVRTSVRFVQSPQPPTLPEASTAWDNLVVVAPIAGQAALANEPRTESATRTSTPNIVYAVARGVVYGLSGSDGRLLWMLRVGLDAPSLPVTVPSSAVGREMTLLLVEAGTALRAVDPTTGALQWQQPLGGTAVGRPVLVGRRVYVAVRDQRPGRAEHGKLYEFSVIDGHRVGWLETGQALAGGITRHANTGLLFCPAESERVYVMNVDHIEADGQRRPRCIEVLDTAHPAGSLRSELVVAGAELRGGDSETPELSWPRYLLVPQADGLNTMKLRAFALGPTQRQDPPVDILLPGWSWFTPKCDGERLALATDAGHLALLGINQPGNSDPILFPLQANNPIAKSTSSTSFDTRPPQRCQVVRFDEGGVWVLVDGQLSRRDKIFDPREGPKFVESNKLPGLGSPLHEPQFSNDGQTIYLVSQLPNINLCRLTAVDAERLTIRWQRQLGLALVDEPIRLADGSLMLTDPSGCVYRVVDDATKKQPVAYLLARPDPTALGQSYLLRTDDAKSALLLLPASPRDNTPNLRLVVRHFRVSDTGMETDSAELKLPARLAGGPIITGQSAILPLSDGTLHRLERVGEQWRLRPGPSWRSELASPDARAYLTALGQSEFLSTDGREGLIRWSWQDGANYKMLGGEPYRHTARLTAAPVVVTTGQGQTQVLLSDVRGRVTLLSAEAGGNEWGIERVWSVGRPGSPITAGPFARPDAAGNMWFGCVIGHNRLAWFNPSQPGPAWTFAVPDGAGLVGLPQRIGDQLLLATQTGRILQVDAKTGQPIGTPTLLPDTMTPSATPIPLNSQRLLVPLTDCTMIFLPNPTTQASTPTVTERDD